MEARSSRERAIIRSSAASHPSFSTSSAGRPSRTTAGYSPTGERSIGYSAAAYSRALTALFEALKAFASKGAIPKSAPIEASASWYSSKSTGSFKSTNG